MTDYLTTAQVARLLGVTPRRVRQLAVSRNVGHKHADRWAFSAEDVAAMRDRPVGRPPKERT